MYYFDKQTLSEARVVQDIIADSTFRAVAQEYIGCVPVLDIVTMWWSTTFQKEPSTEVAQLYHIDLDRAKFLKFFVYLTDVTENNGPHCFIKGSHKSKPPLLFVPRRFTDEEMKKYYPVAAFLELTGKSATIMAVDTSGFHKGKPLINGERLIFQIQFSNSLYGQIYYNVQVNDNFSEQFKRTIQEYGYTYSLFKTGT